MPLLKSTKFTEPATLKISFDKDLIANINQYCEWADIKNINEFFTQAAQLVFNKDKEWGARLKTKNTRHS